MLYSLQRLALTALTALPLLITTSSAIPQSPRQLSSSSVSSINAPIELVQAPFTFTYLGSIYRSTPNYLCPPNGIAISGATFPVQVDLIEGTSSGDYYSLPPKDAPVVATLARNWTENVLLWTFSSDLRVKDDARVFVRITEATGRVVEGMQRTLEEDYGHDCQCVLFLHSSPPPLLLLPIPHLFSSSIRVLVVAL